MDAKMIAAGLGQSHRAILDAMPMRNVGDSPFFMTHICPMFNMGLLHLFQTEDGGGRVYARGMEATDLGLEVRALLTPRNPA